jgi:type VI secretion system protein VasG
LSRKRTLLSCLDELETQYGQELKLTEQLLESRQDISRQSETHGCNRSLTRCSAATRCSPWMDVRTVANVIADWTGVPLSSLMKDEQTELTLENEIGKRVVGQDVALEAIAQRLRAAKTGLTSENGPQGVFLVGPSGGENRNALALADVMYGGEVTHYD